MDKKRYTREELLDLGIYEFFDLIAKSNVTDVMAIKNIMLTGRDEMLKLAEQYKIKMFDKKSDPKDFDENFTRVLHCFALAMYIDKKVDLCTHRELDLTPECFKKECKNE